MYPWYTGAAAPPGSVAPATVEPGGDWSETLRNVAAYGLSRAIDSQFVEPFYPTSSDRYGVDQYGRPYVLGESAYQPMPAGGGGITLSPSLLILAALGFLMLS
jgi:hypothetical protein